MSDTNLSVNMSKLLKVLSGGILDFFNQSKIEEAPIGGIRQVCIADYKKDWSLGSNYYRGQSTSEAIRLTDMQFNAPSQNNDDTQGFAIGSWWVLENGDMYQCSDATTSAAVWSIISTSVPDPTTVSGGGEFDLTFAATIPASWKYSNMVITNLHFGNTVTSIGDSAFYDCQGLTGGLVIPNTVLSIGATAFQQCLGLTSLDLGTSVTSIGDSAFAFCTVISGSLVIPNTVTSIVNAAFYTCTSFNGTLTIGTSVTSIGDSAFYLCNFIGDLIIPDLVNYIGIAAFYGCGFTGFLTIGSTVATISENAFYACPFTGDLIIPDSVTGIGASAFYGCGFDGDLTIGNGVTDIGNNAFENCANLAGILSIGSGVTSIGDNAFAGLGSLTGINCYAVVAPTLGTDVFDATMLADIHVPVGATGYGATYGGLTVIDDL
jgi:hypothetical protein